MGFKGFSIKVVLRTVLVMLNLFTLTWLITQPGYHAATLLLLCLLVLQCVDMVRFVSLTNAELTRFLDAARYADFSQRFELSSLGSGFGELGHAFSDILSRFHDSRSAQEQELKHLKAMVDHVPVPLMSIHTDNHLTLWNNAARRLFGAHKITRLDDLAVLGRDVTDQLSRLQAGERRLITVQLDGMEHQLSVSATHIALGGKQELLVSMQDIQSELDFAQLQAWQDLVRVLTHEIMNSITPVASLATTAVDLVEDAKQQAKDQPGLLAELDDVADAVKTVARRSEGLTQFVGSYRRLTRLPPPDKKPLQVQSLFDRVIALVSAVHEEKGITLTCVVEPVSLQIQADPDMLEQVLLNLLQNAEHAVKDLPTPAISLKAGLNRRGRAVIEVSDNGAGIPEDILGRIFVPFFTTKREGSGVGLALTRQVMINHGGAVKAENQAGAGAVFSLTF